MRNHCKEIMLGNHCLQLRNILSYSIKTKSFSTRQEKRLNSKNL